MCHKINCYKLNLNDIFLDFFHLGFRARQDNFTHFEQSHLLGGKLLHFLLIDSQV